LAAINTYTPVEPAGSRGPLGTSLGFGLAKANTPNSPIIQEEQLNGPFTDKRASAEIAAQRVILTKGLTAPLDFGVVAGPLGSAGGFQWGAHIQATLFEGFRLPAVAARVHTMTVQDIPETTFRSIGGEILGSWSIFGWLTPWVGVGIIHHRASLTSDAASDGSYLLSDPQKSQTWTKNWNEISPAAGMALRLWSPFATAALESRTSGRLRSTVVKLSFGL
jgi:hypothetical protein